MLGVIFAHRILGFVSLPSWTTFAFSLLCTSPFCLHGVVSPRAIHESRRHGLEKKGFLSPPQDVSGWKLEAEGEVPRHRDDEVIVFAYFYERGFGSPLHRLVHGLLHYYQVEIQNLHPNVVLHIGCFIMLCEAFMGIDSTRSCGGTSPSRVSRATMINYSSD